MKACIIRSSDLGPSWCPKDYMVTAESGIKVAMAEERVREAQESLARVKQHHQAEIDRENELVANGTIKMIT